MKMIVLVLIGFIFFTGCGDGEEGVAENVRISECGGFEDQESVSFKEEEQECDQLIIWEYDEEEKVLSILNQDVLLNCCGEHDIRIEKTEDKVEYTMIDNRDNGSRCKCVCLFDYSADIKNVQEAEITISVFIDVEENEGPEAVWEGKINLLEGSGTILVEERSGDHCW